MTEKNLKNCVIFCVLAKIVCMEGQKMKIWDDDEVKSLFQNVEKCKECGQSLVQAFAGHAKKFSRKPNSVRNYYYHEVDNLLADKVRAAKLKIDLTKHQKSHFKNFDKVQEGDLFGQIDALTSKGLSVRGACLKLSGGDLQVMTRFQNKYQNMKRKIENSQNFQKNSAKNPKKYEKNALKMKKLPQNDKKSAENAKIIPFKIPRTLSDADINSLFLGLVRLIKKSAQDESFESAKEMKQTIFKNEEQIASLKAELGKLKKENALLAEQIAKTAHENKKMALEKRLTQGQTAGRQKQHL